MAPKAKATRSSKKAKVVEEVERVEFEIAPLTGILIRLPYETLVEILSLCNPQSFSRMLRTCKGINELVVAEERTLYRKLYHNTLKTRRLSRATEQNHVIYSPVKQTVATKYSIKEELPLKSVYNWKDQYRLNAIWQMDRFNRRGGEICMECVSQRTSHLHNLYEWNVRMCAICTASNLVIPSGLALHQVTAKDLVGIETVTLDTMGLAGPREGKFYYARHLKCLAIQKHGDKYIGPRLVEYDGAEELVYTATLLQGGLNWHFSLDRAVQQCHFPAVGKTLNLEFANQAEGKPFKKTSGLSKRPLVSILTDYAALVKKYITTVPIKDQGDPPYFLPAENRGPLIPSDTSVAAFTRIKELATRNDVPEYTMMSPRSEVKIRAMQNYILSPTVENWSIVSKIVGNDTMLLRNEDIRDKNARKKEWEDLSGCRSRLSAGAIGGRLSKDQTERLALISQIDAILGIDTINTATVVQLLPGKALTGPPKKGQISITWAEQHYSEGTTTRLLQFVYIKSREAWINRLKHIAMTSNHLTFGQQWTGFDSLKLLPCFEDGNNQRCDETLRNRDPVKQERYEEEINRLMRMIRSGLISSSTATAVIFSSGDCDCRGQGVRGVPCRGMCWIQYSDASYFDYDL